jgi:hypothetical protein
MYLRRSLGLTPASRVARRANACKSARPLNQTKPEAGIETSVAVARLYPPALPAAVRSSSSGKRRWGHRRYSECPQSSPSYFRSASYKLEAKHEKWREMCEIMLPITGFRIMNIPARPQKSRAFFRAISWPESKSYGQNSEKHAKKTSTS